MAAAAGRGLSGAPGRERLEASVHGSVQGVGFRWFVVREAAGLSLTGWASNESDGSVRVVAEGDSAALSELEARLREGSPGAYVREVRAARAPATGEFSSFSIRPGAHPGD